jgi:ABC-type oligopeptide transport system ATPase subunit
MIEFSGIGIRHSQLVIRHSHLLLSVRHLRVHFPIRAGVLRRVRGAVKAVDDVSFDIEAGETFGLVGESGSGKSTVGRAILRLLPDTITAGQVLFDGHDVLAASHRTMHTLRRQLQIIFQDPAGSLNPRMRVGEIVGEPLLVQPPHLRGTALKNAVASLLERCGLAPHMAARYPHELSGGQRQRIGIARALALKPKLIVCDEPTSALDVSIQSQILNLLKDLQRDFNLSYLFISHDMAVIDHMCDRLAVMKDGRIVEQGTRDAVIATPQHEYTQTLLRAVPA